MNTQDSPNTKPIQPSPDAKEEQKQQLDPMPMTIDGVSQALTSNAMLDYKTGGRIFSPDLLQRRINRKIEEIHHMKVILGMLPTKMTDEQERAFFWLCIRQA